MPWMSDQLPWTSFKYPKPPPLTGPARALQYMTGPPILNRGRSSALSLLGVLYRAPVLSPGFASKINLLKSTYRAPVLSPGFASKISLLKSTYTYRAPVISRGGGPIIAAKLERFLGHG